MCIPLCKPTCACVKARGWCISSSVALYLMFWDRVVSHWAQGLPFQQDDWPSSPWDALVSALPVPELQMSVTATGFHMDAKGLDSGPHIYRASTSPLSHCPQLWSFHWSLVVQNVGNGALAPGSLPSHHLCIRAVVGLLYISRIWYITSLWKVSHVDDLWDCLLGSLLGSVSGEGCSFIDSRSYYVNCEQSVSPFSNPWFFTHSQTRAFEHCLCAEVASWPWCWQESQCLWAQIAKSAGRKRNSSANRTSDYVKIGTPQSRNCTGKPV